MVVAVAARHLHRRRRVAHPRQVRVKRVAIGGHLLGAAPPLGGGLGDALPIELDELDAERRRLAPADGGGVLGGLVQRAELAVGDQERAAHRARRRLRLRRRRQRRAELGLQPVALPRQLRRPPRRLGLHHLGAFVNPHLGGREIGLRATELGGELRFGMARARRRLRLGARDVGGAPLLRRLRRLARALLRLGQHPPQPLQLGGALRLGGVALALRAVGVRRQPRLGVRVVG